MSKLAHSNSRTMTEIDARSAIEAGNEDCIGLVRIARAAKRRCVRFQCSEIAIFRTSEGNDYCERHAIERAVEKQ